MGVVNEKIVLDNYLEQMKLNKISFLESNLYLKDRIREEIINIRNDDNMHEKIQIAKRLWKLLFEAAMTYIDPDKDGYDKLFQYFDEYVDFEELIFASDSFYRDHTLHCLWVYFLEEYIECNYDILGEYDDYNLHGMEVIKSKVEKCNMNDIFGDYITKTSQITELRKYTDSIRCVSALTHDLGYPLKKINKVNHCIKKILPYFGINDYAEFNFRYDNIQQNYIDSFLEIMNNPIRFNFFNCGKTIEKTEANELTRRIFGVSFEGDIDPDKIDINMDELKKINPKEKMILKELFTVSAWVSKGFAQSLVHAKDFSEYQHGIMSAFLLVRIIGAFGKMRMLYRDNKDVDEFGYNYGDYMSKWLILSSIANHTSSNFKINNICLEDEYLLFVDEIEEFSRMSRVNKNRQYVNEFCKTQISKDDNYFNVDFIFDNTEIENLDPERAFKDRCKKLLTVFNIRYLDEDIKIRIRVIDKFNDDDKIYKLEIAKKYADITIDGVEQNIPKYLRSNQFYTKEKYMSL